MAANAGPALRETFAPILYIFRYKTLDGDCPSRTALERGAVFIDILHGHPRMQRSVLSAEGLQHCNVNISLRRSGNAGHIGGEGNGRWPQSGSDASETYMRRATQR
jgi:aldehyde dehydrogenase (NAD+)